MKAIVRALSWTVAALAAAFLAFQLSFLARIWWYQSHNPSSTAFMEASLERLRARNPAATLKHAWVPYERISTHLKRAIVVAEDAKFAGHEGFDWEAIEKADRKSVV